MMPGRIAQPPRRTRRPAPTVAGVCASPELGECPRRLAGHRARDERGRHRNAGREVADPSRLAYVSRVTHLVGLLIFLVFVEDSNCAYTMRPSSLGAPMGWVFDLLLQPTPLKLRPFDLLLLAILVAASLKRDKRGAYVAPMKSTLFLVLGTTVLWFLWGLM